ncbi:hypothetical protein B0T22DRAFT_242485 [Podospora appendiculata]|uniref:Thymidylate kinase n=1 Tax=Podospora appendiculata TaxID=314037 RepID=A0AAE0X6J4_9PEZI|nr:hypothetical protein B0T22DRAFT_242485 [Podospora appendiculata]
MATVARQPFAPLDGARLQRLTSLKNTQNAISTSPIKRKASESDDFENVDPTVFAKRAKGAGADSEFNKDFFKPSFILTKAASAPTLPLVQDVYTQPSQLSTARPRSYLQPRSPTARLNTQIAISSSQTAPAGRSPTRGSKRIGILSRRRTQRVDPPAFGLAAAAPFSLDAALKGTIPSYSGSTALSLSSSSEALQDSSDMKSSWFFDIHEDTPEQEMTNLLQHSTCTLDISSDEESEKRARRERDEGRDKENIPPADDVSQTSARLAAAAAGGYDDMVVDKQRGPLMEMNVADYYAEGCDGSSVVLVHEDDDAETVVDEAEQLPCMIPLPESEPDFQEEEQQQQLLLSDVAFDYAPQVNLADVEAVSVDSIMGKDEPGAKAAVLEPMDGTGESFELWESGSARDDAEAPGSPAPTADEAAPPSAEVATAAGC